MDEDDSVSCFDKDGEFENVLVPTKRSSRRNTPVPSKYNDSASPSLSDIGREQQLELAAEVLHLLHVGPTFSSFSSQNSCRRGGSSFSGLSPFGSSPLGFVWFVLRKSTQMTKKFAERGPN
ncbi:hypothetical protein KFK09_008521 [Dendrobium nobile]|uniref:Uncharacterized protein n=1 Tax=Dendrobium nobile TaxID=94219 RepID=A0A8T3BR37_DENNO|nr:hypothetical protein KFK09_008521 [Dendrobium nobile]